MYKDSSKSRHKFKILDIEKSIYEYETASNTTIGSTTYKNLKNQLEKIKSILGDEIN